MEAEKGLRYNQGKPKMSFVLEGRHAMEEAARVFEYGANKYARGNWHKGLPYTEVCDSMLRHLTAFLSGEDQDEESGCNHVGHILANAIFLAEFYHTKPELDDRSEEVK